MRRANTASTLASAIVLTIAAALLPAHAETTRRGAPDVELEFEDARLLTPGQTKGGVVHVAGSPRANASLPLVVFLHGLNFTGQKHLWMGGGRADLRISADRVAARVGPFLLAAPSQTKDAGAARTLWSEFELGAFVEAVERASAAMPPALRVDRRKVILVGHSGAGCNPDGGLFAPVASEDETPRAILAIDTCLDEDVGRAVARTRRLVVAHYQETEWPRDAAGALRGFYEETEAQHVEAFQLEKATIVGPDAHNTIVPLAFERALPELLRLE